MKYGPLLESGNPKDRRLFQCSPQKSCLGGVQRPAIWLSRVSHCILLWTARDIHINKDVPAQGVQSLKPGRIPAELAEKAKAFGLCVNKEAQHLADKYGKSLASVMTAAGLSTKAMWNESIWNLHQVWYASTNSKASDGRSLIFSYLLMLMWSQSTWKTIPVNNKNTMKHTRMRRNILSYGWRSEPSGMSV